MSLLPPTSTTDTSPRRDIYSVSRLNREARDVLENSFPLIWVEGEISNFARPGSGHCYFSLKDQNAQVRCAMFRNRNMHLRFKPENGLQVLVRARISLYEGRGEFQLLIEHMEPAGDGLLQRQFEELKRKLAAQGLFETERKRSLPALPRRIGVITSPTGAAIRDIVSVLKRRFPSIPVLVYPVPVQGEGAPSRIVAALELAQRRGDCDVLILARGGGSLEDLWAFNDESLARAIAACAIPIVSGVGHEIDFTIADLVADLRAPTPSAAAEAVSPDRAEWWNRFETLGSQIRQCWRRGLQARRQRLDWLDGRLQQQHPGIRVRQRMQRLDELENRLLREWRHGLRHRQARLQQLHQALQRQAPDIRLQAASGHLTGLQRRLRTAMARSLERSRDRLNYRASTLHTVSPLATLERGYAIVRTEEQKVIRSVHQVTPGDPIRARVADGTLSCTVNHTTEEPDE